MMYEKLNSNTLNIVLKKFYNVAQWNMYDGTTVYYWRNIARYVLTVTLLVEVNTIEGIVFQQQ